MARFSERDGFVAITRFGGGKRSLNVAKKNSNIWNFGVKVFMGDVAFSGT